MARRLTLTWPGIAIVAALHVTSVAIASEPDDRANAKRDSSQASAMTVPAKAAKPARPGATPTPSKASAAAPTTSSGGAQAVRADSSTGQTLKGGEEGTVFRTLTVQGEDRIHIEVERPTLRLDMDPDQAPGLERGDVRDVLERTTPDLESPLLATSSREASPFVAHPWLSHFPEGAVASVRPDVKGVERWRLLIVNARAESVAVFEGKGDPPRKIDWDGRSKNGDLVMPGASYSYVFEARDRAGNKRNFVGEGFRVETFRYGDAESPVLLFSGKQLAAPAGSSRALEDVPAIVVEAASVVNQAPVSRTVDVQVTARSREEANALAQRLKVWMGPLVIGDPSRLRTETVVRSDAPQGAAVSIRTGEADLAADPKDAPATPK
jgi:hypothetical protein